MTDLNIDEMIVLKSQRGEMMWTGFIWLRLQGPVAGSYECSVKYKMGSLLTSYITF
jgi:hypothetical protein